MHTVESFTLISWPQSSLWNHLPPPQGTAQPCTQPCGTGFSTALGCRCEQWNPQWHARNCEKCARPRFRRTAADTESGTRRQGTSVSDASGDCVCQGPPLLATWDTVATKAAEAGLGLQVSVSARGWTRKPRTHQRRWGPTLFLSHKSLFSLKREYYGLFQMVILRHFPNLHKVPVNTGKEALERRRC